MMKLVSHYHLEHNGLIIERFEKAADAIKALCKHQQLTLRYVTEIEYDEPDMFLPAADNDNVV